MGDSLAQAGNGNFLQSLDTMARKAIEDRADLQLNYGCTAVFFFRVRSPAFDNINVAQLRYKIFTSSSISVIKEEKYRKDLQKFLAEVSKLYELASSGNYELINTPKDCFEDAGLKGVGSSLVTQARESLGFFHHEIARFIPQLLPWIEKTAACRMNNSEFSKQSIERFIHQMHPENPEIAETAAAYRMNHPELSKQPFKSFEYLNNPTPIRKKERWKEKQIKKWLDEKRVSI